MTKEKCRTSMNTNRGVIIALFVLLLGGKNEMPTSERLYGLSLRNRKQ